jgi:hypothetical protein
MVVSFIILIKTELFKVLMNPRVVKAKINTIVRTKKKNYLGRELYEKDCLGLHKRLKSLGHHVHFLAK